MAEKINVKDRDIVVPGQVLAEGMDYLPSGKAIRSDGVIISTTVGLVSVKGRVLKVIPLSGRYIPKKNDIVIGEITEVGKYGWKVNLNTPQDAEINVRDASSSFINSNELTKVYNIGDHVLASIIEISQGKFIKLSTRFRPQGILKNGAIVEVSPSKIPRIIGKEGSMIRILKEGSDCDISVGQNGFIWISGEPENMVLVSKAIDKISSESHTKGLTEEVKKILKSNAESKPKKSSVKKGGSKK